ncbi:hypothetical protein BD309DRAFT_1024166 [Dichomitus squalens]|nr:hypothetical protein BD309DRAFT_1024166 [Dichomitus squalens]
MPGTPPIEKQQQLLAQLTAVRQQIWEDEERVERDRAEREKAERERRPREEVELLERERAQLEKELVERQQAEKERAEKERARKPTSECVKSPQSSWEAGPSKRRRDDDDTDDNNNIVDITPKQKQARTETLWAPAKKSCAECKEKRIACLFSVGHSRARACQACARSKTKCTRGQRADKTPAVVISNNEPPVTPAGPSTPRKKAGPAEKPTEKAGPVPGPSSKARRKKRETTAEQEERERKQKERERKEKEREWKEKEINNATAPKEADLPFSRRGRRENTILKTLCYAMSEIRQFREELEEYFGGIADLLEGEPSDSEGHPESDPDWAEMERFGVGSPDWEVGSEAEHGPESGQEQEAEGEPEQEQE